MKDAEESVELIIEAEDEEDESYDVQYTLSASSPLSDVARKWAQDYKIPDAGAVVLQNEQGLLLDVAKTPRELGWIAARGSSSKRVKLTAVPLDETYAEQNGRDTKVLAGKPWSADTQEMQEADAAAGTRPVGSEDDACASTAQVLRFCVKTGEPLLHKKDVVASSAASPSTAAATVPKPDNSVAKAAKNNSEGKDGKQKSSPSAKGSGNAKASAGATGSAASGSSGAADGRCPTGDDPVTFQNPNPKRTSSKSGERYEKYMKAKTVNEAIRLGACQGDIKFDWNNGYMKRRT
jgi:hypothetical protein